MVTCMSIPLYEIKEFRRRSKEQEMRSKEKYRGNPLNNQSTNLGNKELNVIYYLVLLVFDQLVKHQRNLLNEVSNMEQLSSLGSLEFKNSQLELESLHSNVFDCITHPSTQI